jgi:hypothetical protein
LEVESDAGEKGFGSLHNPKHEDESDREVRGEADTASNRAVCSWLGRKSDASRSSRIRAGCLEIERQRSGKFSVFKGRLLESRWVRLEGK